MPHYRVLLAAGREPDTLLLRCLKDEGVLVSVVRDLGELAEGVEEERVDGVVVDLGAWDAQDMPGLVASCQQMSVAVLVSVPLALAAAYDPSWGAGDFFLSPPREGEVTARLRQMFWRSRPERGEHVVRVGDVMIDMERYEVTSRDRPVLLTFKEYQLLCLLASNPGRVFSREALMNQIWGYDYYGGSRTVDVHIRRVRSKLGATAESYIETVWNVGYRFRDVPGAAPSR